MWSRQVHTVFFIRQEVGETNKERGKKGVNRCEELGRVNDTQVTVRSRLT